MGACKPQGSAAEEPRRRKRYHLPQDKIDHAKAILGTRTDSETIERALEQVVASILPGGG